MRDLARNSGYWRSRRHLCDYEHNPGGCAKLFPTAIAQNVLQRNSPLWQVFHPRWTFASGEVIYLARGLAKEEHNRYIMRSLSVV